MISVERWENYLALIKANIKLITLANLGFSFAFLLGIPFIQGIKNLDSISTAVCLENFVAMIGIILLVPIFSPEEAKEIDEIVVSKSMPQFKIYGIRIFISLIAIFTLVSIFILVLKYNNCDFPLWKYLTGTFLSSVFLGTLGLFFSAAAGNSIFGYMVSIGYSILNMMTKNKYVGKFYIMSMRYESFSEKYWLLGGSIVLIFMSLVVKFLRRKFE